MDTLFCNFRVGLLPFHSFDGIQDPVGYHPLQEIQLSDRRREPLELDAFRPTERIEKFFTVPVQARLISDVYRKHLTVRSRVRHVVVLRVVRHEPLNLPEGRTMALTTQNRMKLLLIIGFVEELRHTCEEEGLLRHYLKRGGIL